MKANSERIPGKNMRLFCGRPLFHWILESLNESGVIDEIIINTDSEEIANNAKSCFNVTIHMRPDYLLDIHTELKQINHIELDALSRIIRDEDDNIVDKLHQTIPFLTKYERARILGLRTKQINRGSAIFVKADKDIIDGYNIALLELEQKKIPFIIQRPLPNGGSEYWNVSDLEIIDY